jgi:Skp family chaperone for outer membrane proteins
MILTVAVLALALTAAPTFAQPPAGQTPAQPPATQPTPTQPPATQPPAAQPQAARPPVPFPQDAKIAFVDINAIASNSAAGRDASAKLKALQDKKVAEINEKNKQLQAAQAKLSTGGSVLNDAARQQLEKDIDRMQREIQFANQNAQAEFNDLNQELQADFQKKLMPIIEQVAAEKNLYAIFSIGDAGALYVHQGLDVTPEVVKRLDAGAAAPVKKN